MANRDGVTDGVTPEWTPPARLRDPYVRRLPVDRARWSRSIRGRLRMLSDYAVAYALANYANRDGSNAHPGTARLAEELATSESTVKRAMAWLTENGWVTITQRGRRKLGEANVHQLTIPAPVGVEIGLWAEANGPQWMERPDDEPRRPGSRGHPRPLEDEISRGHPRPVEPGSRGHGDVSRGHMGPFLGVTHDPPPGHRHQGDRHHSAQRARPHAPARGSTCEEIEDHVEERLGHGLDPRTCNLIAAMWERDADPTAIVNAAVAHERDLETA
jgi:hypothetical protein